MQRLYRAIAWIAGVAIVVGLLKATMLWTQAINTVSQGLSQGSGFSLSDGTFSVFFTLLRSGLLFDLMNVSNLLVGGVMVMTVIVAWADRRSGWLIALLVVTLLALLWPLGVQLWIATALPTTPPPYPTTLALLAQIGNNSSFAAPLIPLALAVIFALTQRKSAAANARNIAVQPA